MSRIGDAMKRAGTPAENLDAAYHTLADMTDGPGVAPEAPFVDVQPANGHDPSSTILESGPFAEPANAVDLVDGVVESSSKAPTSLLQSLSSYTEKLIANPKLPVAVVEQYRRLAAILHHAQRDRGIRRVLVASALAEEGKTLTASNLALTLSESYGRRVLLVDADLRRPGVNLTFGIAKQEGLSEALESREPRKLQIVQLSPTLSLLPAGHASDDPMQGLTSLRMAQILEEASETFDWVVVDSPPVGLLPDAKLLAHMMDAVLLVIAAGKTPFDAVKRATESIGRERVLGVVLNRVSSDDVAPYYYDYYRYYGYGSPRAPRPGLMARLLGRR